MAAKLNKNKNYNNNKNNIYMQWNKQNDLQISIKEMRKKNGRGAKKWRRRMPKETNECNAKKEILNKHTAEQSIFYVYAALYIFAHASSLLLLN